jgi:hypothetical protein
MKKTIFSIMLVLMAGLSAFAAREGEVNQLAVKAFQKEFRKASNVEWTKQQNSSRVTFTIGDRVLFASYNDRGKLEFLERNLPSGQLPLYLLGSLKNKYKGYWITRLLERDSYNHTNYYATLQNADWRILLKSEGDNRWSVYSKTKKYTE